MSARFATALCLLAILAAVSFAASEVEPTGSWAGKIDDESLRKLAPESGFIADAETWKKLWSSWRAGEELPEIDFSKELILVGTVPGPNNVLMRPKLDEKGDVAFLVAGTKIGGPGFGYKLLKIKREGVKSVKGKPIEAQGVQGVLLIPKAVAAFEDHKLEIQLWEYDPLLADASATLVGQFEIEKYGHEADKETETAFSVGAKLRPRPDRRYYITVFVLKDGQRTHIGEQDGKSGLCNVLTDGNPTSVKMITRAVR